MAVLIETSESNVATEYNSQRKLVRTSTGRLYAVYFKVLGARYQIYIEESDDDGATWGNQTLLSTGAGMNNEHQYDPSIAVDSNDYVYVVWRGQSTAYPSADQIWLNTYTGSWSGPTRVSDAANMSTNSQYTPCIAVDSNDYLHVVWHGKATDYTTAAQIWYNKYTGSWAGAIRISTFALMQNYPQTQASIAVDSNDYLHVVWHGKASGFTTDNQIWYNTYTGAAWVGPVRISDAAGMNNEFQWNSQVAVDSGDDVHVVWAGKATGFLSDDQIWYNTKDGGWAGPIRLSVTAGMQSNDQQQPTVAVDQSDNIHVIWSGTAAAGENDLWHTKYSGVTWSAPAEIQGMANGNRWPNIRWSFYPASLCNVPFSGCDYCWTNGAGSPYDIYYDTEDNPFPPSGYAHSKGYVFG